MEDNRNLRFLIPPFVFLASLCWGVVLDKNICLLNILKNINSNTGVTAIIGLASAGGIVVIAIGFLFSAISILGLRIFLGDNYEVQLQQDTLNKDTKDTLNYINNIMREIGCSNVPPNVDNEQKKPDDHCILCRLKEWIRRCWTIFMTSNADKEKRKRQMVYIVSTYDHYILPKVLNEWIRRRWTTFMTSSNCVVALIISHLIGCCIGVANSIVWILTSIILIIILRSSGLFARRQALEMIEFLSKYQIVRRIK